MVGIDNPIVYREERVGGYPKLLGSKEFLGDCGGLEQKKAKR